jgi:DNA polymerase III sliding clamp (beta) subunit (PCNA family)
VNTKEERVIEVGAKALDTALGRVIHAAAENEARPILCTILFEGDEQGFRLVAADNYRIAVATLLSDDASGFGRIPLAVEWVPTLRAFLKTCKGNVILSTAKLRLIVTSPSASVSLRTVDGTFPNYASVIPTSGPAYGINPAYVADTAKATKGLILRLAKNADVTAPFLIEAEDYREAIMAVRIVDPDGAAA